MLFSECFYQKCLLAYSNIIRCAENVPVISSKYKKIMLTRSYSLTLFLSDFFNKMLKMNKMHFRVTSN